jgi:hypothetical protein
VTGKQGGTFIDTGKTLRVGAKVWPLLIHESAALILGRHVGMLDRNDAADLKAEAIASKQRIAQLEDELAHVNRELDGVDALVKNRGYVVRKAPGRKKNTPQEN